jgi:aminocarboxymuconate-semialdehyde decarboxylase
MTGAQPGPGRRSGAAPERTDVIDIHAHQVPRELRERLASDGGRLGVRLRQDGRLEFASGEVSRPIQTGLYAPPAPPGCTQQIVSPWIDLFGYGLDPERGAAWARLVNTSLGGRPALATVPLQDGRAAAEEVHWALGHGLLGVEIGTNVRGRELSDPGLDPFWAACRQAGAPVLIHPAYTLAGPRVESYYLGNLAANFFDTTLAAAQLIFGGVLDRHPGLVPILAHGGGYLPYQFGRLDRGRAVRAECRTSAHPPRAYLREFYYDTVVHSAEALRYLVGLVGADRVLVGTDSHFDMGDPDPMGVLTAADLPPADRDAIAHGNAAALFRREG